ncbi:murein transglycosylase domain-containing protein [Ferrigenium sp. UT5]|uniref:murein transglycosylase domain-containing protein n=1 Tax=Ferrigenium sp. UT5 TaxID=3242105 RepID=UPI00354EE4AD
MNNRILLLTLTALTLSLPACSTRQLIDVATAKDPKQVLRSMAEHRVESYKYNPRRALSDLKKAKADFNRLMGNVQKESGAQWGKKEARTLPSRTRYVKYTERYKNRVVVDYDAGTILIEHLEEEKVADKLRNAAVVALLTPDDPGAVDLFSDKEIALTGKPYLQELVVDENGAVLKRREDVERYADYLVANRLQHRSIDVDGISKNVQYIQMRMVNAHLDKRAVQYAATVRTHSEKTQVSRSLIYAVIKTESSFNPYAVSGAPAYGMMQLVPASGGREAYRKAKGKDVMPSKEYLFDANNNIELGATYLGVLLNDSPLREIRNPVSREYCAIAAYNTGPSNVFRAFSKLSGRARQDDALDKINALRPDEVFDALRSGLPYKETRGYVVKVVEAKKRYATM